MGKVDMILKWQLDKFGRYCQFKHPDFSRELEAELLEILSDHIFHASFSAEQWDKIQAFFQKNPEWQEAFWRGQEIAWQDFWREQYGPLPQHSLCPCTKAGIEKVDDYLQLTAGTGSFHHLLESMQIGLDCRQCLPAIEQCYKALWRQKFAQH